MSLSQPSLLTLRVLEDGRERRRGTTRVGRELQTTDTGGARGRGTHLASNDPSRCTLMSARGSQDVGAAETVGLAVGELYSTREYPSNVASARCHSWLDVTARPATNLSSGS